MASEKKIKKLCRKFFNIEFFELMSIYILMFGILIEWDSKIFVNNYDI